MNKLILFCLVLFPLMLSAQSKPTDSTNTKTVTIGTHTFTIGTLTFPPKSDRVVTDYTQTLTPEEVQKLENKLDSFNSKETAQIAVVIMSSIGTKDIMYYGTRLANRWGIGYSGVNNGILVLVALEDRQAAIIVGTGLEKTLPDELCHEMIQNDLIPNFKKQQYYTGLDKCTNSLMKYVINKK
jgi:uncharacterized protein